MVADNLDQLTTRLGTLEYRFNQRTTDAFRRVEDIEKKLAEIELRLFQVESILNQSKKDRWKDADK